MAVRQWDFRSPVGKVGNVMVGELTGTLQLSEDDPRVTGVVSFTTEAEAIVQRTLGRDVELERVYLKGPLLDQMRRKEREGGVKLIQAKADRALVAAQKGGGEAWGVILNGSKLDEATAREVREAFGKLPKEEQLRYLSDVTVFKALQQAPEFLRRQLVSDVLFEQAREKIHPEASKEIRRWQGYSEAIAMIRDAALEALR